MSDKKKGKQRVTNEENKVTKEEYAVAKYLRFGLPVRDGKMHGMEVKCFIANAAIDKLLESKWSASKNKTDPLFTNRASCIYYMNVLLEKGLFHRADRDKRKKDKDTTKKKKKDRDTEKEKEEQQAEEELRQRKGKKEKKSKKEKEEQKAGEVNKDDSESKDEKKKEEKKKREKRLKLLMSDAQWFEDGDEVYVWIYDPVNVKTFLIGLLMVLGAIGLCMFPLWPEEVRIGVYYLSLAAAGFVGFILFLAVVRLILFCCVWAITMGRHHFWFLPNLTEDVGFFDSFRPLYKHDYMPNESDNGKKKKKKKSNSKEDKSESMEQIEKSSDKDDSDEFEVIKKEDLDDDKEEQAEEEDENNENSGDEEAESEDIDEDDTQNNGGSEKEDKKSK